MGVTVVQITGDVNRILQIHATRSPRRTATVRTDGLDLMSNHDYTPKIMKTKTAIDHFGSRKALAEALGISREATYGWGDFVPEQRQYQLQVITAGRLVASKPDLTAS